jgi:hypothetical protein
LPIRTKGKSCLKLFKFKRRKFKIVAKVVEEFPNIDQPFKSRAIDKD